MIDIKKQYKTRDGKEVTLITDKGRGHFPVMGYIEDSQEPSFWTLTGFFSFGDFDFSDLVEVKETKIIKYWVNCYPNGNAFGYSTKEKADAISREDRIGEAVEITKIVEE